MQKDVKITYLAHSGFLVEFQDIALIFDYYKGKLPESIKEKKLYVFASHFHQDHYTNKILEWTGDYHVTYILSRDIKAKQLKEACEKIEKLNIASFEVDEKTKVESGTAIDGGIYRVIPRREYVIGDCEIYTLRSTDIGVAFLVKCQGHVIYHAGDLQWWDWPGEEKEFNLGMEKNFKKEIKNLSNYLNKHQLNLEIAFLPLDYRQEESYALGFDYFLNQIPVKQAVPMHMWGVYKVVDDLLSSDVSKEYRDKIVQIQKRGDEFYLC